MRKLFEVREFDVITKNPAYQGEKKFCYMEADAFDALGDFIRECKGGAEGTEAAELMRIGYRKNVGDVITLRSYVGLIQLKNGDQIQVLPKLSFGQGEDPALTETKRVFLRMLRTLKDFPAKVFRDASLQVDRMNLYEVFIQMFLKEVQQLVKRGIRSGYVAKEDNLPFYKGKLLVNRHIQENAAHRERFYVCYDEFHPNRAENRLVKATLLYLQKQTRSASNAKEIRQLLTAFELVEASVHYEKDFAQVSIDRNTGDYKNLMAWARVFLMKKSFTTFSGSGEARALLFPMEKVYEEYVAHHMKRLFQPAGWEVSVQEKKYYLFTEPRRQFSLQPDLVLRKDGRTVVLDTKWKRLIPNEKKNYGIAQADMYQMYAYGKKYQAKEIWLLYPRSEEMAEYEEEKPLGFASEDGVQVRIFFVDVAKIEESLLRLGKRLEKAE